LRSTSSTKIKRVSAKPSAGTTNSISSAHPPDGASTTSNMAAPGISDRRAASPRSSRMSIVCPARIESPLA
jgi:hypothetical protein